MSPSKMPLTKFSISDLSDDEVRSIVQILARRPNHGISRPSRQWLKKQEAKVDKIPTKLQRPRNPIHWVFIRVCEKLDMADPNAILCSAHWSFHPKMVRPIFMSVTCEVSSRSNQLRNWPDLWKHPILADFVGKLNSVSAYWLQKDVYRKLIGKPPEDPAMAYVHNNCEACILAAIGANGSVLCALRALLLDRVEREQETYERLRPNWSNPRPPAKPRLLRFVETWINCLAADDDVHVRAKSDDILEQLRNVRRDVRRWWWEQKRNNRKAAKTEVTSQGNKQTVAVVQRRTKNGILVANIDQQQQKEVHKAAEMYRKSTGQEKQVYRDDTVCNWAEEYVLRPGDRPDLRCGPRSEVVGGTRSSDAPMSPTDTNTSSQRKFFVPEYEAEEQLEAQDPELELKSREKVKDWYSNRIRQSVLGLPTEEQQEEDTVTMLSGMHPALRPDVSGKSNDRRSVGPQPPKNQVELAEDDGESEYVPPRRQWTEHEQDEKIRQDNKAASACYPQSVLDRRRQELLDNQSTMFADSKSRLMARDPTARREGAAGTTISRPASTWETVYMESEVSRPPISRAKSMGRAIKRNERDDEEVCEDEIDTKAAADSEQARRDEHRRRKRRATESHSSTSKRSGDDEHSLTSIFARGLHALTGSGSRKGREKDRESHKSSSSRTYRRAHSQDHRSQAPSRRPNQRCANDHEHYHQDREQCQITGCPSLGSKSPEIQQQERPKTAGEVSGSGKYRGRYHRPSHDEDRFRDSGFVSAGSGGHSTRCSGTPYDDSSSSCYSNSHADGSSSRNYRSSNTTASSLNRAPLSQVDPSSSINNGKRRQQGVMDDDGKCGSSSVSGPPLPSGAYEDPHYEDCVAEDMRSEVTWGFDGHSRIAALEPSDSASNYPSPPWG